MLSYINNKENQIFLSFTGGFALGWLAHLSRAELILKGFHNYFQVLSLVGFAFTAFLLWFKFNARIPRLPMTRFKMVGIIVMAGMMLLANSAFLLEYTSRFLGPVVKDLMPVFFILCGPALGLFTTRQRVIFGSVFLVFLAVAVYSILRVNVNVVAMAASRSEAFDEVGVALLYSYQVGIGATAAMLLLYFITTVRSVWLSLACAGGAFFWLYTSLIYSKRQGLGEFLIISGVLFVLIFFGKRLRHMRGYMIAGIGAFFVGSIIYVVQSSDAGVMLDRVVQRFTSIQHEGLENLDRVSEATGYLRETSPLRIIFGQGMGGFSFQVISTHVIHMGWVNLIFKGGILLPFFYFIALTWNILYVISQRGFPNKLVVLFFSAFLMFRMLYSPAWGFLPSGIFLGVSFFAPEIFLMSAQMQRREQGPRAR